MDKNWKVLNQWSPWSYEKTRKFEKALSFTNCTCLNVWKKCPCVIWKFSCVSRLKNGSLGSFRGLGLRPRPQKEPWLPFFNLDTQENFQITLGQFFQTLRQDNAWRKEPLLIATICNFDIFIGKICDKEYFLNPNQTGRGLQEPPLAANHLPFLSELR